MKHATQVALTQRFFRHIDQRSTDSAAQVSYNTPHAYASAEHLAHEKSVLFQRYPLLAGLSCQIPAPGDFMTADFAGVPTLVTRANDGALRAFLNVCRHRGSRVEAAAQGCGRRKFTCPYHAWSYNLEGELVGLPDAASFGDVERSAHGLVALPVAERHGLIWLRHTPQPEAIDVDALLGATLSAEIAAYDLSAWHHYETRVLEYAMNWKGVIDTFLEAYHFGKLHRASIASIFFDNLVLFDGFERNFRMSAARRSIESVRGLELETPDLLVHMAHVYGLFPNAVLVRQGEQIETWRVYPGATPDTCRMVVSMFIAERADTDSARRHWDNNMNLLMKTVLEEDFPVGASIQANFHSGAQQHVIYGRNEPALAFYHRSLREAMGLPEPMLDAELRAAGGEVLATVSAKASA